MRDRDSVTCPAQYCTIHKSDGLGFVSALYADGRRSWRRRIVAALRGCLQPLLRKIAQLAASYSIVPIDGSKLPA